MISSTDNSSLYSCFSTVHNNRFYSSYCYSASLLELFIDGSEQNRHFHNLAMWYGRAYTGIGISNPIEVGQMVDEVVKAINNIRLNTY